MEIKDIISKDGVALDLSCTDKRTLLEELSELAAKVYDLSAVVIADVIAEREKLGTTGVGYGIAIPHGKLSNLSRPVGVMAKLDNALDFGSPDGKAVDIVCLLLGPENAGADHLNALACISGLLKNDENRDRIRNASTIRDLQEILGLR